MTDPVIATAKLTECQRLQNRGQELIPGLTQLLSKRPDRFAPGVWPCYYDRAKGAEVWDLDGNHYLDMSIGGIGANILGYADPDIDAAVMKTIERGVSCSLNCPEDIELAELLRDLHPWAGKVRYARTGGEAMAIAVRLARAATGRDKVAFCGYHGWHDWYLAANVGTENALGEHLLPGLDPAGVPSGLAGTALPFRYNQLDELEAIVSDHGDDLAAIVMEPIRSDRPVDGFFDRIRRIAASSGAVFVLDEISAGFRMNSGGAHLTLGVTPDMAVFAKAIGNGYPMAAIIGTSEVMEAAQVTFISSTNWTERVGPTAAIATIRKHCRLNVGDHLVALGGAVQSGWREAAARHGLKIHVGGIKPMSHFSFESDMGPSLVSLFVQLMLDRGFLAANRFYAMYAHSEQNVKDYLTAVDETFGEIAEILRQGQLEESLRGGPISEGFTRLT